MLRSPASLAAALTASAESSCTQAGMTCNIMGASWQGKAQEGGAARQPASRARVDVGEQHLRLKEDRGSGDEALIRSKQAPAQGPAGRGRAADCAQGGQDGRLRKPGGKCNIVGTATQQAWVGGGHGRA